MDQEVPFQPSSKKGSKRSRQNTLIAVGLVMFFLSMFISAEKMITLKAIGAMLGLCIFCVGLYLRGMKES